MLSLKNLRAEHQNQRKDMPTYPYVFDED